MITGGIGDWLERGSQKANKASHLWEQLRCKPPGELWELTPTQVEATGSLLEAALGVLSWNFCPTLPAGRAGAPGGVSVLALTYCLPAWTRAAVGTVGSAAPHQLLLSPPCLSKWQPHSSF